MNSIRAKRLVLAAALAAAALLSGCASIGVKPWQREILARPDMALDADRVAMAYDEHIYFSKEAASGGRGFGGGGCGCN